MSRRERSLWILAAVVALLIGVEVGLNLWRGPEGGVEVENAGAEPIEGLVLTWRGNRSEVGRVAPGASAKVWFSGRGTDTLTLRFRQKGNALGSFEMPGFSPAQLDRDGSRQVLRIRTNEVERYQDDREPSSSAGRFLQGVWRGIAGSLDESSAPQ